MWVSIHRMIVKDPSDLLFSQFPGLRWERRSLFLGFGEIMSSSPDKSDYPVPTRVTRLNVLCFLRSFPFEITLSRILLSTLALVTDHVAFLQMFT